MLPRLEAEERLASINDAALAAGRLKRQEARTMIRRLERAAHGARRRKAARPADPAVLARMGIAVRGVSAASEGAPGDG